MKVKFEIEIPEHQFNRFSQMFNKMEVVSLPEIFKGYNAVFREIIKNRKPLYGIGAMPVGYNELDGEVKLDVVSDYKEPFISG